MIDIVIPNANEAKFIEMAEKLGYTDLILLYDKPKKMDEFQKITSVKLKSGVMVNPAKQSLRPNQINVVPNSKSSRYFFESKKTSMIFNLELGRKEYMHHRNSGLNQVLCKFLKDNEIRLALNFSLILDSYGPKRASIMGRMAQNIRFAGKYGFGCVICSFAKEPAQMRSPEDLIAFFSLLGMEIDVAKSSMSYSV